jgi:hypothetical protein
MSLLLNIQIWDIVRTYTKNFFFCAGEVIAGLMGFFGTRCVDAISILGITNFLDQKMTYSSESFCKNSIEVLGLFWLPGDSLLKVEFVLSVPSGLRSLLVELFIVRLVSLTPRLPRDVKLCPLTYWLKFV